MVGVERGGGVEQQLAALVRLLACGLPRLDEEVGEELHLEMGEARVVEDPFHLRQRARFELVGDVRVPEPDPLEADPRRLRAAVAPIEQTPFASDVRLGRTAHRPVQGQ